MKLTKDTLIAFIGGDVDAHSIRFFENFDDARGQLGISKRSILRSIQERTETRGGWSWDYAENLISEAREMVGLRIKTQEWFDETFKDILP